MRWLAAVFFLVVPIGCSSSSSTASSGDGGAQGDSSTPLRTPARHRAAATTACTGARAPGQQITPAPPNSSCATDADCTMGNAGRCNGGLGIAGGNSCTYDACTLDSDCGSAAVCQCRVTTSYDANSCFQGNCVTDADCGAGGYCSPSAVDVAPTCRTGLPPGSVGFFCHTTKDDCVDDADCKGTTGEPHCMFKVDTLKWSCFYAACTG